MKQTIGKSYPLQVAALSSDHCLAPYKNIIMQRHERYSAARKKLLGRKKSLAEAAACEHHFFGLHKLADGS